MALHLEIVLSCQGMPYLKDKRNEPEVAAILPELERRKRAR
jgi:hypothetical protein